MKKRQIYLLAAACIALCIITVLTAVHFKNKSTESGSLTADTSSMDGQSTVSSESSSEDTVTSSDASSSSDATNEEETTSSKDETTEQEKEEDKPTTNNSSSGNSSSTVVKPSTDHLFPGYKYNSVFDIEDNVFIDSLVYTGYNLEEHKKDGLMWQYVLSKYKKGYGWLSNISFGGGSTGLETTSEGLPDIKFFEKKNLVCASFASYVYFNYLPNVAKIDTSALELPEDTKSANSFYQACKKWLKSGQTYNIGFKATDKPSKILFEPDEEIPIGSIIVFRDKASPGKTAADHITIYVGEKNGYHWVIQTGNKNGPEFCAVERFKFGPDPQWPLAIFATPKCIYDAAGEIKNQL